MQNDCSTKMGNNWFLVDRHKNLFSITRGRLTINNNHDRTELCFILYYDNLQAWSIMYTLYIWFGTIFVLTFLISIVVQHTARRKNISLLSFISFKLKYIHTGIYATRPPPTTINRWRVWILGESDLPKFYRFSSPFRRPIVFRPTCYVHQCRPMTAIIILSSIES